MRITFFFLSLIVLFQSPRTIAQDTTKVQKPKVEFNGFFRFDYWYDSRQNVDALDGLLVLYPKAPELDANGEDINAAPSLNGLAMGTRLKTTIDMPKVFNAKSRILVEVDFTGSNNTHTHIRFRHGYTRLTWNSGTELDVGLTWHPMFVTEVFPYVAALNTGSPFQSFNRSPQITIKQNLTPSLKLLLSALSQSDYKGYGPEGYSTVYLRNGLVPNFHAQLQANLNPITAGFAIDFKSLRPRLSTKSITDPSQEFITKERISSITSMAYLKIQSGMFTAKFKGMLGQNMGDHLMLGGYAVSSLDANTGKETYTPFNHLFLHANITYGKKYIPSIYMAYAKNMGTTDDVYGFDAVDKDKFVFGRGVNIDNAYRIAPSFTYKTGNLAIMLEGEYTFASFGQFDVNNKAKVINTSDASNLRALLMIQYDF